MNCPGASPLGCTPCTWIASFQEHISSPISSAISPSTFLKCLQVLLFLEYVWDEILRVLLLGLEHLGFFHQFHSWLGTGCAQRHQCRGITAAPATKTCPVQHLGWISGCWCTNWLWLVHGIFGFSSINCMGIHAWADWVLMHKTHPSVWVLRHDLRGHSSMHWLGTCVPLAGCSCMYQLGSHAQTNHMLIVN